MDWVDPEWPGALKKALRKLWDMYEESKRGIINDNLAKVEEFFKLEEEKK